LDDFVKESLLEDYPPEKVLYAENKQNLDAEPIESLLDVTGPLRAPDKEGMVQWFTTHQKTLLLFKPQFFNRL
jgi:hypothetical protein